MTSGGETTRGETTRGKRLGGETTRGGNGLGAKRPGFDRIRVVSLVVIFAGHCRRQVAL